MQHLNRKRQRPDRPDQHSLASPGARRASPGSNAAALVGAILASLPGAAWAQGRPPQIIDETRAEDDPRADDAKTEREAKAAADAAHLAAAKGVKLTFRLGVRFLQTAPFSKVYQHVLTGYGYGSMSAIVEGGADVAVSPWRWLDLGVHTGYSFGSAGSSGGSGGVLTLHAVELGGFACAIFGRNDRRKPGTLGVGVEGGAMLPFLILRGDVESARLPYIGPVILARLAGDARIQTAVHVRYLVASWNDLFGSVGLPLGGFSISGGVNLSL